MELTIEIFKGSIIKIIEQKTYYDIDCWHSDPIASYDDLFVFQRGRPEFQTSFHDCGFDCEQALFIQGRSVSNRDDSIYFQTDFTMMEVINKLFHCFDIVKVNCKTHRIKLKGV